MTVKTFPKERQALKGMKKRCYNKKHKSYNNYGGRGIYICDRWLKSFENFLSDMGISPTPKHTIERINNDGNYEPDNCKWATYSEQALNRRIKKIEIGGVKKTIKEWCAFYKIRYVTVGGRIRSGWPQEKWFLPAHSPRIVGSTIDEIRALYESGKYRKLDLAIRQLYTCWDRLK